MMDKIECYNLYFVKAKVKLKVFPKPLHFCGERFLGKNEQQAIEKAIQYMAEDYGWLPEDIESVDWDVTFRYSDIYF